MRQVEVLDERSEVATPVGAALRLTVKTGVTGRLWEIDAPDGVEVEDKGVVPGGSFGGAGLQSFAVVGRFRGAYVLRLALKAPWRDEPDQVREVLLNVE